MIEENLDVTYAESDKRGLKTTTSWYRLTNSENIFFIVLWNFSSNYLWSIIL